MSILYKNIALLCEEKGIKGAKMCTDIGMSKGILTDLKMGRRSGVNAVTAQKIASYFGVTVGYLLGSEEKEEKPTVKDDELSSDEKLILELFRQIPPEQQRVFLDMGRVYADSLKKDRT